MNYDEKLARLKVLWDRSAELDSELYQMNDEITAIIAGFSPEESKRWTAKVQNDLCEPRTVTE